MSIQVEETKQAGWQSRERNRTRLWLRKTGFWYLFLVPALLLLVVFIGYPLVESLSLGLYKWNGLLPRQFVGVANFAAISSDRFFWGALSHTLIFAASAAFGTVIIGLLLAVVISRDIWGSALYRFVFYLPVMLPMTVVGVLWARIYETNFGLLNTFLRQIGLPQLALLWLADVNLSLWSIIAVAIWQFAGFPMIVLLAAIENIPLDLHDAATIDGVNGWNRLWSLILPLIRPVLVSISMLQLIFSLKVFDLVWVMTKGGPAESSQVLGTYLYRKAFELREYGYASAVAVVMFVIIFSLTYLYQTLVKVDAVEF